MSQSQAPTLHEGLEFPDYPVCLTNEEQAEKLACCGVDPGLYGRWADITAFAGDTIMATKHAGFSINGSVHVGQVFELRESIALDEPLVLRGRVSQVEPEPRGQLLTSSFEAMREDGTVPLVLRRTSLRMDPAAAKGPLGGKPRSEPARDTLIPVLERTWEPEKVARYSLEAENLIHSDPEVARQFGFAAPIAGGLMAVRLMMEVLARQGRLAALRMSIRFRRPMFWDDHLTVSADSPEHPTRFAVFRPNGKVVNDAEVTHVEWH